MAALTDNMRGALLMAAAMTAFTINDAFMKIAVGNMPLMQAIFLRSIVVVPLMLLLCTAMGQLRLDLSRDDWRLVLIRTAAEMVGTILFLTALTHMPLPNVSAIMQALPLTVSLAAALVYKEQLGWRRFTAIIIGFIGVLLIVRPGGGDFTIYSVFAVGTVLVITVRDLTARRMSTNVPSTMAGLVAGIGVLLMSATGMAFETWTPVQTQTAFMLVGAAGFIIGGYVFSVSAMRVGEISFVAPFRYTSLLVALILGFVVFGDIPKVPTWIGAGIVVATGLFTLYRERVLRLRVRHSSNT